MSFPQGQTVVPFGGSYDRFSVQAGDEPHVIERAAMIQIKKHIEEECERQDNNWLARDREYAAAMNLPSPAQPIERVAAGNFFVGARPSLVASSIDFWPSITTRSGATSASSEQFDEFDVTDTDLFIEVLCKFGPVKQHLLHRQEGIDAEGGVLVQVQRLSAAVHMCIRRDPTLGGIVPHIQRPPSRRPSFPTAVAGDDEEGSGDYWLYAGRQLRYVVQANSY